MKLKEVSNARGNWMRAILLAAIFVSDSSALSNELSMTVTPAATGRQLVRVSLPLPKDMLRERQTLVASDGKHRVETAVRVLTRHPAAGDESKSARRALVTFPYTFASDKPVQFTFQPAQPVANVTADFPVDVKVNGETVVIGYRDGPILRARLLAPARQSAEEPRAETVESNAFFLWQRIYLPDAKWPRVIEIRTDALGGVVVVAHLQRNAAGDGRAPDFGWEMIETSAKSGQLREGGKEIAVQGKMSRHVFTGGAACEFLFADGRYRIFHPAAPLKRRGRLEAQCDEQQGLLYRYWRCTEPEKVPMQQAGWQRAEFVVAPSILAPLTVTLESPHEARLDWQAWDALYDTGAPLDLKNEPALVAAVQYHHDAMVRCMAHGDDWGNVTSYSDDRPAGAVQGMNRLNHCSAFFEESYRTGDRRLAEVGVLWCDNFYDQSIWWGEEQTGGTRYPNIAGQGRKPPDDDQSYMWRSNGSVSFCTKGFESFFIAYEQTGDPRMMEALRAQVDYVAKHFHAGSRLTRNIGVARDFLRLHRFTGAQRYLDEALRLFRELRTQLSTGDLFTETGRPIEAGLPFIDADVRGRDGLFAKPYIIGYALAGLPELARLAPDEPKLRDVVRAVADFLAESQDALGGWRYPHPRSSQIFLHQAIEHAWQLEQADKLLGAQEKHLDAIERVLRQRILGWQRTGKIFGRMEGWEIASGKVRDSKELGDIYQRPADRDFTRDYAEGRAEFGGSAPEGLVYFPEVLAFYLQHRPASRLLAPAREDTALGKVLARMPEKTPRQ